METQQSHSVSVVIPVYRGETSLPHLVEEIEAVRNGRTTQGEPYAITEIICVCDGAVDGSARVLLELQQGHPHLRPVWLSRNFGQHPATLAGIATSTGAWIVTLDEDGQQNPADIAAMLSVALSEHAQLVYAKPKNKPPHGLLRNMASGTTKWILTHVLGNKTVGQFNSFRVIEGDIARSLAAYCGNSVFLDVALSWVVSRVSFCPVMLRGEQNHRSGYSMLSLLNHFWRLVLTSGTRPLRTITFVGVLSLCMGVGLSVYALWVKIYQSVPVQGWTSLVIVVSLFSGCILFALGIIAEYLAVSLGIVMGKPLYLVMSKPPKSAVPAKGQPHA